MGATGNRFTPVKTGDRVLEDIQQALVDVFDQLEDARRGLLVGTAVKTAGNYQIGENLFVEYTGPGGHTFSLPSPTLRGANRAFAIFIANNSKGTLIVKPTGQNVTFAGAASVTLAAGVSCWAVSLAGTAWYRPS